MRYNAAWQWSLLFIRDNLRIELFHLYNKKRNRLFERVRAKCVIVTAWLFFCEMSLYVENEWKVMKANWRVKGRNIARIFYTNIQKSAFNSLGELCRFSLRVGCTRAKAEAIFHKDNCAAKKRKPWSRYFECIETYREIDTNSLRRLPKKHVDLRQREKYRWNNPAKWN